MLVTPDGQRIWPAFGTQTLVKVAPIRQYQFVQLDRTTIEARFVPWRPIAAEEEQALLAHVRSNMPAGLPVTIRYVGEIARGEGGKYEDFVCNVRAWRGRTEHAHCGLVRAWLGGARVRAK